MNEGVNPGHELDDLDDDEDDDKKQNILNNDNLLFRDEKEHLNIKNILARKKLKGI